MQGDTKLSENKSTRHFSFILDVLLRTAYCHLWTSCVFAASYADHIHEGIIKWIWYPCTPLIVSFWLCDSILVPLPVLVFTSKKPAALTCSSGLLSFSWRHVCWLHLSAAGKDQSASVLQHGDCSASNDWLMCKVAMTDADAMLPKIRSRGVPFLGTPSLIGWWQIVAQWRASQNSTLGIPSAGNPLRVTTPSENCFTFQYVSDCCSCVLTPLVGLSVRDLYFIYMNYVRFYVMYYSVIGLKTSLVWS